MRQSPVSTLPWGAEAGNALSRARAISAPRAAYPSEVKWIPSATNQVSWTAAAQSKMRIFGYLAQARSRASFHSSMFPAAYGPLATSDFTFTHITGASPRVDIMVSIRSSSPIVDPTETLAVSLVPRASTQQPL